MDFFEASLARLHQLSFPSDLSFTRDGTAVVAAVRPAAHEPRQSPQSRVWRFSLDGAEAALPERGVESELVVYPREGHGLRERDHQLDAWRRTIGWFDRYLGSPR
jgi:hypothetical protein